MKKKANIFFKIIICILLFTFLVIFYADRNGYYNYNNYKKMVLTEDGIKKFESDVDNGVAIDINNYIENDKDYSNNISNVFLYISNTLNHYLRKGIVKMFDAITSNIE